MIEQSYSDKLLVFTAPSGAGKTTIVRHLLNRFPNQLAFSISATTREKRDYEEDGLHYYFISEAEFREKMSNDDFVEYEEVYPGTFYGTLKSEITRIWSENKAVLFDIDVKGAEHVKAIYGDKAYTIFVMPPSLEVLTQRLIDRGTESEESLKTRVAKFKREMNEADQFDAILLNDDLENALLLAENLTTDFLNS